MSETTVWFVAVEGPGRRAEWDWESLGTPDPRDMFPVRQPSSGDFSRHIPVTAYSVTTGSHHELESTLEHELLRVLEHQRDVVWMLAQPVQLHLPGSRRASHVPDLLSLHDDGSVTLWDARPRERVDEAFEEKAELTRIACAEAGWRYETFHGSSNRTFRLNMRWIHEDRRHHPWHQEKRSELRELLRVEASTVGTVLDLDDPELTSTMWHHVWTGDIACDLERHLRQTTELTWVGRDE